MIAATALGIFIIPVLFILIIRVTYGKQKLADLQAKHLPSLTTPEQKEQQE
jgi:HAE1 family hydrophobic/amphiphilic exporter-1